MEISWILVMQEVDVDDDDDDDDDDSMDNETTEGDDQVKLIFLEIILYEICFDALIYCFCY